MKSDAMYHVSFNFLFNGENLDKNELYIERYNIYKVLGIHKFVKKIS